VPSGMCLVGYVLYVRTVRTVCTYCMYVQYVRTVRAYRVCVRFWYAWIVHSNSIFNVCMSVLCSVTSLIRVSVS
jgi:hypothetical protein